MRLSDTNAIRWRWAPGADGSSLVRESNSRLVRWSDGSVTLAVGDEVMEAREHDVAGDNAFLFARHPNLIQGQGPLTKKLVFRPTSLTSGSHRRLAAAIDRQHGTRQQRVRATATLVDPKKEKEAREKAEEARIRDLEKLASRQEKQMRKYTTPAVPRQRVLSAAYLEDEEGEEEDEDDDGFIVHDEDEEGAGPDGVEGEEEEGEEDMLARRFALMEEAAYDYNRPHRAYDAQEEEEAEARLTAAKTAALPPALADEDVGEDRGGEDKDGAPAAKKRRTLVMESDSE